MGGYYTGNGEIIFRAVKYIFIAMYFSVLPCVIVPNLSSNIPAAFFLNAVQKMDVYWNDDI
jgi:hypothetical protein